MGAVFPLMASSTYLPARFDDLTAAGQWEKLDSSGKPQAEFQIMDCNGLYQGKIVKAFRSGGIQSNLRCASCEGKQKNASMLGLIFIKGMRREGREYRNGTVLDPRNGYVYDAQMELSRDGRSLSVRGYRGIPLFGQSEVWHRVRDKAVRSAKSQTCSSSSTPSAR
jgi:uncharacterized protein (DUF2147 family)